MNLENRYRWKADPNMYLEKEKGPKPKANKSWQKIVVDIVSFLVVFGGLAALIYWLAF